MRALGQCWLNRTGNGRCGGEVGRWVVSPPPPDDKMRYEVWLCRTHEGASFRAVTDAARPVATSALMAITPLKKPITQIIPPSDLGE